MHGLKMLNNMDGAMPKNYYHYFMLDFGSHRGNPLYKLYRYICAAQRVRVWLAFDPF